MSDIQLRTSDNSVVWIEDVAVGAEEEVLFQKREHRLTEVIPAITSLCHDLSGLLAQVGPDKASVEFGMSFRVETTGLTVLVAKAGVAANFKVVLEWSAGKMPGPPKLPAGDSDDA